MVRPFLLILALSGLVLVGCNKSDTPAQAQTQQDDPEAKLDRPVTTEDTKVGTGDPIQDGDLVMLEYVGHDAATMGIFSRNDIRDKDGDGTQTPLAVYVGAKDTMAGLSEGLRGMKKGGQRTINIPWQKGYGAAGSEEDGVGPKQDLSYDVTVLDIVPFGQNDIYDVKDVKVGHGPAVKKGDRVWFHYRGTYSNGMLFDDSRLRGDKSKGGTMCTFKVGSGEAILGLDDGIRGMKVGGVRQLRIPPQLVFQSFGNETLKGNQVIYLKVELEKIDPQ